MRATLAGITLTALLAAGSVGAGERPQGGGRPARRHLADAPRGNWAQLGWLGTENPCNIEQVDLLSVAMFRELFKGRKPVVFRAGDGAFRNETTRQALLAEYGSIDVTLSSSNSFSAGRMDTTLGDYIESFMMEQGPDSRANESWYLFGDTRGPEWLRLQSQYQPPLDGPLDDPAVSLGLGGLGSGVSFHTHGPAFAETVHGSKRWFLSPPARRPDFHPNESSVAWVHNRWLPAFIRQCPMASASPAACATLDESGWRSPVDMLECTVPAGSAIYIPDGWWHATLNMGDWNVFVSTFTHEPPTEREDPRGEEL
ncbi:hypothetical protein FNF27_00061 [Cafeteria roenbergensis]|uniref:JmjC domain-containing protein n=1 Tax=Cafeteria roenbergensis TaxID=33653 RepID=A0A5A8CMV1_CAFRO|nr:hypothetical protein FNF29_03486 [Cafeteria roenbergensis]KAA0154416.1 hypothetical protein FNF31_06297 [Cafeteria roenbergensis]KAA0168661.1 hypothetical protein FNF28_02401 [Cafeteria roenbergensis]KAA0178207.1 hypothetical protein FNF27_00061 [Cafeteria roenbergensis]|eukprot:KAA0152963.1 hypothetical protein FNF29_03486 [Cafeteria roenbergensis]